MVAAATEVSLLRKHGSHSSVQLFSLSLVEASGGFRAAFDGSIMCSLVYENNWLFSHTVGLTVIPYYCTDEVF